jgi:hypothetical protein
MGRFNIKKPQNKIKNSIKLKSPGGLHLWKTLMMWTSEIIRISKQQSTLLPVKAAKAMACLTVLKMMLVHCSSCTIQTDTGRFLINLTRSMAFCFTAAGAPLAKKRM